MVALTSEQQRVLNGIHMGRRVAEIRADTNLPQVHEIVKQLCEMLDAKNRADLMLRWLEEHAEPNEPSALAAYTLTRRLRIEEIYVISAMVSTCLVNPPQDFHGLWQVLRDYSVQLYEWRHGSPTPFMRTLRSATQNRAALNSTLTTASRALGFQERAEDVWEKILRIAYLATVASI